MSEVYLPALHSVSYAGAWPGQARLDLEAFLAKAAELGFPAVALAAKRPHLSPLDFDAEKRRRVKERLRELGLEPIALMGYTDFTAGLEHPGIPSAEMNACYVGALAQLAADVGAPRLRIFSGYRKRDVPEDAQYGALVEGLRAASREAARYGVTLVLQNHHDLACHHEQLAWLLADVGEPNLKAAFDAWAPFLQGLSGEELAKAVERIGPWIELTTVADYVIQPRYRYDPERVNYVREEPPLVRAVPPGKGQVDYESFFRGLRKVGYRGPVVYEMCAVLEGGGSIENLDRTARSFLDFLEPYRKLALGGGPR